MSPLALHILAALESGTLRGDRLVDLVRDGLTLERAAHLPTLSDFRGTGLALQHKNLIACPNAPRPVWGSMAVYQLTDAGRIALQRASVPEDLS